LLFNSLEFLLGFLPAVLLIYYLLPHRLQNAFLVLASCFFYASWDWRFLLPLLATTSLDYWAALRMEESLARKEPMAARKKYLILSVVLNLSLLGFFKYFNFFADTATLFAKACGIDIGMRTFEIILPVAISFYTFQALSYTIDVYRGEIHATKSFWDFFLAVLYFPHLVAGPIQRAATLIPQVVNPRVVTFEKIKEGLHLIVWGFFKKIVIADNLAPIVNAAFSDVSPSGGTVTVGVIAFAFQIYCDFSGYTDIARGIAKLMGFEFMLNFNLPYFATNPADFWRRWHISLSTWLRDYLYKPLGGNRGTPTKTYRNLMITMVLGGLWHGAAWNFILWGFYHGALLAIHRLLAPLLASVGVRLVNFPVPWFLLRIAVMFALTCYGWLLFRATSLHQVVQMSGALRNPFEDIQWSLVQKIALIISPLLIVQILQWRSGVLFFTKLALFPRWLSVVVYSLMIYLAVFHGGQPQAFVYFQF
jgi:alginate O-acetyltransferase complex protein AlgI